MQEKQQKTTKNLCISVFFSTFARLFAGFITINHMFTPITAHIEMDRAQKRVRKDGQEIHLTGLEFSLLEYLCTHPNKLCSRDELIEQVWGERFLYDPGTIDVHLNALRRKMGFDKKQPIETVRGMGLIFRTERQVTHYTIDLSDFLIIWLTNHEAEIRDAGLVPQLHLTPFVNQITISPEALRRMLDSILAALLPTAQAGYLRLSSKLTVQSFILALEINGTISELIVPIQA
jgi:DNA-binding winged helix-turn-helix (wHTH) protein